MTCISDVIIHEIGEAVGNKSNTVLTLGIHLGLEKPVIDAFIESNKTTASPIGTKNMLFKWKNNTRPHEQIDELRKGLIKSELLAIAEKHLPERDPEQSIELLCLICDTFIAKITDVITKKSSSAVPSKVRIIRGQQCLVQLIDGEDIIDSEKVYRKDVITMTTADVTVDEKERPTQTFEGYQKHRLTFCKGCPFQHHQIGWYFESTDGNSAPFHAVFLQHVIHDTYDSVGSLIAFFQGQMNVSSKTRQPWEDMTIERPKESSSQRFSTTRS